MPFRSQGRYAILVYLLLGSSYLLYLPQAEFVLDDWLVLGRYQTIRESGRAAELQTVAAIVQNRFHGQFRFQWISFSIAYLLFLLVGYSPKIVFAVFLLLHIACAVTLRDVVDRLGIGAGPALIAGAVFLLLPSTHGPLFWSHNCSYYIWSTFWFLLYMRSLAATLGEGRLTAGAAARQAVFLLLALFSGDPIFCLLLAAAPLTAWYLRSKAGLKATLLAWGVVLPAAAAYALLVNKAPIFQRGVGLRYSFTFWNLWSNVHSIAETYQRLTGLGPDSFYKLSLTPVTAAFAALAGAVAIYALRVAGPELKPLGRTLLFAAALWVAALGPIWFLLAHEFRYEYVPSPFLALALAVLACRLPVLRLPLAAALMAWVTVASIADIEQCWIPQSENLRLVARRLRELKVDPGDVLVVSNTTQWIGTAPNFAFLADWASTPFAEHVTGVHNLDTGCDIIDDGGRLRLFHYSRVRDLRPEDASRLHILVDEKNGRLSDRHLLAEPVHGGNYRLHPLKGYAGPAFPPQDFTREQLALMESDIYFARPYAHHKFEH